MLKGTSIEWWRTASPSANTFLVEKAGSPFGIPTKWIALKIRSLYTRPLSVRKTSGVGLRAHTKHVIEDGQGCYKSKVYPYFSN